MARNIVPRTNKGADLGTPAKNWNTVYADKVVANIVQGENLKAVGQSAGDEITLRSLIASAGSDPMSITVYDDIPITDDLIIPPNIELYVKMGGKLSIDATKTITINGHFSAGPYQVFSGDGNVVFGDGAVTEVYPDWWGTNTIPGTTDMTVAINKALESLSTVGGEVKILPREHLVSGQEGTNYCITIPADNIILSGYGPASVIKTTVDADIPICIIGAKRNITITKLKVKGTGNYAYYGLQKGRGILIAELKVPPYGLPENISVTDCDVVDMSMIGICTEGAGYTKVIGNRVHNCLYTAINYNGRAYQSIIADNICSGSTGAGPNSSLIQATSMVTITGNTVYNSTGAGILWGESNTTQMGTISNNVVKNCARSGIKAMYTGPVTITGNTVTNCSGGAGIFLQGGTYGSYSHELKNCIISNNIITNCYPFQIQTSSDYTIISGNQLYCNLNPMQPSGTTAVDYITVKNPEAGIAIYSSYNSVYGNTIIMGTINRPIVIEGFNKTNFIYNNMPISNVIFCNSLSFLSGLSIFYERGYSGAYSRGTSKPTAACFSVGDKSWNSAPAVGQPIGWTVTNQVDTTVTSPVESGTTLEVDSTAGMLAGDVINVVLDNGLFMATTIASVTDANTLELTTPIPSMISVGNNVYTNRWVALPNL